MINKLSDGLLEATRLTRAGRVGEATALLQHLLRGKPPLPANDHAGDAGRKASDVPRLSRVSPARDFTDGDPFTGDIRREGGRFLEQTHDTRAGGHPYKLYVPSGYR